MLGKVKKNPVPLGDWAQGEEVSQVQAAQRWGALATCRGVGG